MELTTKGRYAVRVMADLARQNDFVSLTDVAQRLEISIKYLEKIISMLSKANLVKSMRGTKGGYILAKKREEISVKDILDATDDSIKISTCLETDVCPIADKCDTIGVWETLNKLINNYLENVTLKDLVDQTCERKIVK
ncbi:MAG: Rrf2 family transcriptional regulator [Clostridia bacterium]|nr:Rrf2 family transcriptional regulator [Clostridia bacterium]